MSRDVYFLNVSSYDISHFKQTNSLPPLQPFPLTKLGQCVLPVPSSFRSESPANGRNFLAVFKCWHVNIKVFSPAPPLSLLPFLLLFFLPSLSWWLHTPDPPGPSSLNPESIDVYHTRPSAPSFWKAKSYLKCLTKFVFQ